MLINLIKFFLVVFIFCFSNFISEGQNSNVDSLLALLETAKEDTNKITTLNLLSRQLWLTGNYNESKQYANKALLLSLKLNYAMGAANAHNILGNISWNQGNYPEAIKYHFKSLELREKIGDRQGIANSLNNIGLIFWNQGNYPQAIAYHYKALRIREDIGDNDGAATSFNNIGLIYYFQGDLHKALEYYFKSVKIKESSGDKAGLATLFMNIGNIYDDQKNFTKAYEYHAKALKIREEIGDKTGIATSLNNLGINFFIQNNYSTAYNYFIQALKIEEEIGNKQEMATSLNNIGLVYMKQNKFKDALVYSLKSLSLAREVGELDFMKEAEKTLSEIYEHLNDNAKALKHYKSYIGMRDSLVNKENTKKTVQQQMQYEFDKKEALAQADYNNKMEKQKLITDAKSRKQKIIIISVIAGFLLVSAFAIFILQTLRLTRKQKKIIEIQKTEVEVSKKIIERKNVDITDSISYAKRIQEAKLPGLDEIYSVFPESFVLFKPKDIVSGDFYYFKTKPEGFIIASADCTGHGVPGALMSMIGSEKLDEAVSQYSDPSEILSKLNIGMKSSLRQSKNDESTKDGMDIALCRIEKNGMINFAGANRPLWIIRNGEQAMEEFEPTKRGIGGITDETQYFLTKQIGLNTGDTFYIFSDGYADTFSGKSGKKLKTRKFKELLLGIQNKTMDEQKKFLEDFIENWRAGIDQVDDILVIGVRLHT